MPSLLTAITVLLIIAVCITLIRNDFWLYKVLEYPRLQKLTLLLFTFAAWLFYWPFQNPIYYFLFGTLCLCIIYVAYKVWPYTTFKAKEMQTAKNSQPDAELKIFAANVFQDNRQYAPMLQQIRDTDPDIIFLLETNAAWAQAVQSLEKDYPYTLKEPLENTYGLLFFSRLKLEKAKVAHLVKPDIPSIEAVVQLRSGQKVQLWGLHPEPPVPGENLYSTAKDKELMKIAFKAKDCPLPCIVFGDLNDVAWSHTTELFRKTSKLLDPRIGRGFYSTFSAHHWYIRFPLDYIFCSQEFGLVQMKRLPKNGSDHFATFTHLAFNKQLKKEQSAPQADREELQEAKEMAQQPLRHDA